MRVVVRLLPICALLCFVGVFLPWSPPAARADAVTDNTATVEDTRNSGPSLLQKAKVRFVRLQRDVNRALSDGVVALKDGQSSQAILIAMLIAFAYGVLHAIGPGHGKAVILGYVLARDGSIWRGMRMGAQIAVLHVISAVVIVIVVRWLLDVTFAQPVDQLQVLKLFSYGAITAIGVLMLASVLRTFRRSLTPAIGDPTLVCRHHQVRGERGLLSLAVGLIPCSGAVLVLLYALANGLLASGLIMAACIALGMGVTLSAIGISAAWMRARAVGNGHALSPGQRYLRTGLDLLGPLVIVVLGTALLLSTVFA